MLWTNISRLSRSAVASRRESGDKSCPTAWQTRVGSAANPERAQCAETAAGCWCSAPWPSPWMDFENEIRAGKRSQHPAPAVHQDSGTPREPQATARTNPSLDRRDSRATSLVIRQGGMEMSKEKPRNCLGYWLRRDGDEQGCVQSQFFYRGRDGRRQNERKSHLWGQNCPVGLLVPSRGLLCAGPRLQMGAPPLPPAVIVKPRCA